MEVEKALINIRHMYMKVVDANGQKPPELSDKDWEVLKSKRGKKESQLQSIEMKRLLPNEVFGTTPEQSWRRQLL
jgi:hypothetical protein